MTDLTAVQERVSRGVKLLENYDPLWRDGITREKLELSNLRTCILGQLFGGYSQGCEALFGDDGVEGDEAARAHGFEVEDVDTYPELQAAWVEELL